MRIGLRNPKHTFVRSMPERKCSSSIYIFLPSFFVRALKILLNILNREKDKGGKSLSAILS